MTYYLLMLRDHEDRWAHFSPEEQQAVIQRFNAWNDKLRAEERFVSAGKLTQDRGSTVRGKGEEAVVDGPYSEAKEAIGGFFLVRAESAAKAAEIAKGCPVITYGGSVEVREMAALIGVEGRID